MKKLFALLLALIMVLSLAACGGGDVDKPPSGNEDNKATDTPDGSKPDDSQPSDEEKLLAEKADAIAASFGSYNGQPIVWRVLDVDVRNERALLITKDCLTEAQFHAETPEDLTWRTSDLRVWLTGEFHFSSFTDEEKGMILEVENPQDTNSETGAKEPDGYETTDTVFILSASEMKQYFADDEDMAGFLNGESFSYWTRTPGNDTTGYVCTYSGGGLYMTGNQADSTGVAVRPAIWVDLSGELAAPGASEPNETPDDGQQSGEAMTISRFLEVYGLTEDDFKPEHFMEFGEFNLMGEAGGMSSMGTIEVKVDKEQTTEEHMIAWYGELFDKLVSLSDTGKLYEDMQGGIELADAEAATNAANTITGLPAFECFYPYPLPDGRGFIQLSASYAPESGAYTVLIWVAGFIR